jgi:hypothetical protein
LIQKNGLTVLVDACGGNDKERNRPHFHRRSWPWLETLGSAGQREWDYWRAAGPANTHRDYMTDMPCRIRDWSGRPNRRRARARERHRIEVALATRPALLCVRLAAPHEAILCLT